MDRKILLGFAMTVLIILVLPAYWLLEPSRQVQALQRQQHEIALGGAEIYVTYCSICHGDRGQGLAGPALRNMAYEEADLVKIISRGRAGTIMPPWSTEEGGTLKELQIKGLAFFLKHWSDAVVDEAHLRAHGAVPIPVAGTKLTPGAAKDEQFLAQGKALFTEKGCEVCHDSGAGGTGLAPFIKQVPREIIWRQVRSPAAKMPAFSVERLSDIELEAILAYLNSL